VVLYSPSLHESHPFEIHLNLENGQPFLKSGIYFVNQLFWHQTWESLAAERELEPLTVLAAILFHWERIKPSLARLLGLGIRSSLLEDLQSLLSTETPFIDENGDSRSSHIQLSVEMPVLDKKKYAFYLGCRVGDKATKIPVQGLRKDLALHYIDFQARIQAGVALHYHPVIASDRVKMQDTLTLALRALACSHEQPIETAISDEKQPSLFQALWQSIAEDDRIPALIRWKILIDFYRKVLNCSLSHEINATVQSQVEAAFPLDIHLVPDEACQSLIVSARPNHKDDYTPLYENWVAHQQNALITYLLLEKIYPLLSSSHQAMKRSLNTALTAFENDFLKAQGKENRNELHDQCLIPTSLNYNLVEMGHSPSAWHYVVNQIRTEVALNNLVKGYPIPSHRGFTVENIQKSEQFETDGFYEVTFLLEPFKHSLIKIKSDDRLTAILKEETKKTFEANLQERAQWIRQSNERRKAKVDTAIKHLFFGSLAHWNFNDRIILLKTHLMKLFQDNGEFFGHHELLNFSVWCIGIAALHDAKLVNSLERILKCYLAAIKDHDPHEGHPIYMLMKGHLLDDKKKGIETLLGELERFAIHYDQTLNHLGEISYHLLKHGQKSHTLWICGIVFKALSLEKLQGDEHHVALLTLAENLYLSIQPQVQEVLPEKLAKRLSSRLFSEIHRVRLGLLKRGAKAFDEARVNQELLVEKANEVENKQQDVVDQRGAPGSPERQPEPKNDEGLQKTPTKSPRKKIRIESSQTPVSAPEINEQGGSMKKYKEENEAKYNFRIPPLNPEQTDFSTRDFIESIDLEKLIKARQEDMELGQLPTGKSFLTLKEELSEENPKIRKRIDGLLPKNLPESLSKDLSVNLSACDKLIGELDDKHLRLKNGLTNAVNIFNTQFKAKARTEHDEELDVIIFDDEIKKIKTEFFGDYYRSLSSVNMLLKSCESKLVSAHQKVQEDQKKLPPYLLNSSNLVLSLSYFESTLLGEARTEFSKKICAAIYGDGFIPKNSPLTVNNKIFAEMLAATARLRVAILKMKNQNDDTLLDPKQEYEGLSSTKFPIKNYFSDEREKRNEELAHFNRAIKICQNAKKIIPDLTKVVDSLKESYLLLLDDNEDDQLLWTAYRLHQYQSYLHSQDEKAKPEDDAKAFADAWLKFIDLFPRHAPSGEIPSLVVKVRKPEKDGEEAINGILFDLVSGLRNALPIEIKPAPQTYQYTRSPSASNLSPAKTPQKEGDRPKSTNVFN
jgi:hypothetical protein